MFIIHTGSVVFKEKAVQLNSHTVKAKSGIYLTLVDPSVVEYKIGLFNRLFIRRPRVEKWFLHIEGENILRDMSGLAYNQEQINDFVLSNGLYHLVTEIKETDNPNEAVVTIDNEDLTVTKTELVKYKDKLILPFIIRESDYIRYETKLFEESQFFYHFIKALARDPSMMRDYKQIVLMSFVAVILAVFFAFGGINLIKFW